MGKPKKTYGPADLLITLEMDYRPGFKVGSMPSRGRVILIRGLTNEEAEELRDYYHHGIEMLNGSINGRWANFVASGIRRNVFWE